MSPVIPGVIEQHAEEAAFLWGLRDLVKHAPHFTLATLARLDDRVEAHLDGLRIAGDAGWEICKQVMEGGAAGEIFVAAVLAFESGQDIKVEDVLKVATTTPEVVRQVISALVWVSYEQASKCIKELLSAETTLLRRVGLAACAILRRNPGLSVLQAAFAADDPLLKARALRAVGELGLVDYHITARSNLKAKDPTVRFWAAWSNALLNGHKDAVAYLQGLAESSEPLSERAAQMAMRRLAPNDAKTWLKRLVKDLDQRRTAVLAAGAFADPEAIPFLIDQMKDSELARVAGESFSLVTGADLAREKLRGTKPEGFQAGPTDNPEDENVEMDPDEHLPWPDPELVRRWWADHQGSFTRGARYLLGQPITPESLRQALKVGYQRQRAAAAIELAILKPGHPLFEVRAAGWRQQALLG
jgi:uncharacterized protein (TIGR02270 family)